MRKKGSSSSSNPKRYSERDLRQSKRKARFVRKDLAAKKCYCLCIVPGVLVGVVVDNDDNDNDIIKS